MSANAEPTGKPGLLGWLDDRVGWSMLKEFLSHKTVPMHRFSVFYYLGGMTLFFFLVQVCTGVLLMLYYRPSADEAYESIEFLVSTVPFGWLVRSIHAWSANLMVFFAFVHLVSVFFMKAYRPPRELTWVTGVVLLFLILAFGFSGYLLPWNQLSFFATRVGTDIAGVVPGRREVDAALPARRRSRDRRNAVAFLWMACRDPAGDHGERSVRAPRARAGERDERSAGGGGGDEAPDADEVLPALRAARSVGLDLRARRPGRAGGAAAVGARREGRSVRAGVREHPAGVVLRLHVPDAEARPGRRDHGRRIRSDPDHPVRAGRSAASARSVPRSRRGA